MQKKIFECIDLTCLLQDSNLTPESAAHGINGHNVINGMLSRSSDGGMLFQETITKKREVRNAKLFEGKYVSLVRRKDGYYYPLLKAFSATEVTDAKQLAFNIYSEVCEALSAIE